MINILNLTFPELETFFTQELGQAPFRARQVWQWLWQKGARDFDEMLNLAKETRALLNEKAVIVWPELVREEKSADGTVKFLLRLADGELIETVLIPSEAQNGRERFTQCLSCQVGCAMGCTFCSTGSMGFKRNMSMAEILGQVLFARAYLGHTAKHPAPANLVFMGMGEPLLNFRELMRALEALNNEQGLAFSPRRITVSTCGIEKGLKELGESGLAYLAVSLHAPNQALRERIMPKAARWPLPELLAALAAYPLKTREKLTFEYLLLGGVNDSLEHARELVKIMSKIKSKLNLIAYNPPASGDAPYKAPERGQVLAFEKYLWDRGVTAILRKSKGQDINAACGQLRTAAEADHPPA